MVATRGQSKSSLRQCIFVLSWNGTKHGQGRYEFESMMTKKRAVWSHVKNKQYVIWSHKGEWLFGKRSELNRSDPGIFAWCDDSARTPTEIRDNWKILNPSSHKWVECLEFRITATPDDNSSTESSETKEDYASQKVTPEEEDQARSALKPLKINVLSNSAKIEEFKEEKGSVEDPRHIDDLKPLEQRLYNLEKEELQKTTELVNRIEAVYSQVQGFCRKSRLNLRREELKVLKQWDMLKYTTTKQLKDFLREKRKEKYFIRGYGFIGLSGTKETLAKRVKRVLDQMEDDDGEDIEKGKNKTLKRNAKEEQVEKDSKRKRRRSSLGVVG